MSTAHSIQVNPQDAKGFAGSFRLVRQLHRPRGLKPKLSQRFRLAEAGFMKASWRALLKQKDCGRIRTAGSIVPPRD
jgi:hypothetical protein